jgi:hypothetical protein
LRNSRLAEKEREKKAAAAVPPLQAAFGEASGTKESAGLGIEMNAEMAKEPGPVKAELSTPPKPATVTEAKSEGFDKPASFLSPVREVRTPSPTVTRSGLFQEGAKAKPQNGAAVSTGSPARRGSSLAEEIKAENVDGKTKKAEPDGPSKAKKIDANAAGAKVDHAHEHKSKKSESANADGSAKSKKTEPATASRPHAASVDSAAKTNGVTPPVNKPSTHAPGHAPQQHQPSAAPNAVAGGWQQTLSKKAKRNNRKSASVGTVSVESERKGG